MRLDELARRQPFARPPAVPAWTLGCWKRRSISFATGEEDTATEVIWIQSHGLTGDLRLPANRPPVSGGALEGCSRGALTEWLRGEGFAAETSWGHGHMRWNAFTAFQPYDKWPEPGRLERVGNCLVEWAPSGAYVEDWRLQPGSDGLLAGLRLVSEAGADGIERPREGALVIAGDHALRILGRADTGFKARPLHEQIGTAADAYDFARRAFGAEVSYAEREGDDFRVTRSVNPYLEGSWMFGASRWSSSGDPEVVLEHAGDGLDMTRRRWRIDTLVTQNRTEFATPITDEGANWLALRRDALGLPSPD